MSFGIITNFVNPKELFALGGGPSQPEVQSFEPVGTTDMVNLFTGDFTYNIPLIDVGGYPINISYNSGITADQEASWVGLGWNINPGVINRGLRGLPDDFAGDEIVKEFYLKPNTTVGVNLGLQTEIFGLGDHFGIGANASLGVNYNNYRGVGMDFGVGLSTMYSGSKNELTGSLGFTAGTNGVGINPSLSYQRVTQRTYNSVTKIGGTVGLGYNNRAGLSELSVSGGKSTTNTTRGIMRTKDGKLKVDKVEQTKGSNGGASISFATQTYTPQISMPMNTVNASFRGTLGAEFWGMHPNVSVNGYFSRQSLAENEQSVNAYGYMYLDKKDEVENPLLDFNRENDGAYNENIPALPLTNLTYDTYSVSGQGIGGMYRLHRGRFGIVDDREESSGEGNVDLALFEAGGGTGFHIGTNIGLSYTHSNSGAWSSGDEFLREKFSFEEPTTSNSDYENVYFKQAGEKTYDEDQDLFDNIGGFNAVRVGITVLGTNGDFEKAGGLNYSMSNDTHRETRAKRNEVITTLTAEQAQYFAVDPQIHIYDSEDFTYENILETGNTSFSGFTPEDRVNDERKAHHISEVTAVRSDGARYIYGIPAYNLNQNEVSFAIPGTQTISGEDIEKTITGITGYQTGVDDVMHNNNGIDEYYSKESTPAFAHSYLLSHILSTDYADSDDIEGPSDQDMGTYVKFNYSKIDNYSWRVPYEDETANYNEGFRSDKMDDKASYIEGEKELWYLHSIETKTHVAIFKTSERNDGKESGGGAQMMMKLDEIVLYNRLDYIQDDEAAIPIKTIHFVYDYSLCQNVKNQNYSQVFDNNEISNDYGKLTLKQIYFTYGKSQKGILNKYKFSYGEYRDDNGDEYSNSPINPDYNIKSYDRWGNYQENLEDRPNAVFPYTNQTFETIDGDDLPVSDRYATAWNLSTIELPSGGKIKVDYEEDDYAYVQDKKAMQMYHVVEVSSASAGGSSNELFNNEGENENDYRNIVKVKLPAEYNYQGMSVNQIKHNLLNDENGIPIKNMYFKFLVDVGGDYFGNKKYEFVPGYAEIDYSLSTVTYNSGDQSYYANIYLKNVVSKDVHHPITMSPIVQAALNFAIIYMPRLAYDQPDPTSNNISDIITQTLEATETSLDQFFHGTNITMVKEGKGQNFIADRSIIRLYNPVGVKKGGGSRVKRVLISDEWNTFTGSSESSSVYGQVYDYTIEFEGRQISSGVAAYEPGIGNEENPFRQPVPYTDALFQAPDKDYYQEEPFGESFFPAPTVGYRKVKVTDYVANSSSISKTGWIEHEFYTAYDFPTKTSRTKIDDKIINTSTPSIGSNYAKLHHVAVTQGFVIELNDMHGKPKSTKIFGSADGGLPHLISGNRMYYKTVENPVTGKEQIINSATIIKPDKTVVPDATIGVDYDFVIDMRQSRNISTGGNLGLNLDLITWIFPPMVIPIVTATGSFNVEDVQFRSVVATKVINRYALLDSTVTYQDNARIINANLAYDSETGEVLLSRTQNEFEDQYYSFTYPSHWVYKGMGQAYKNTGLCKSISTTDGYINSSYVDNFVNGDVLAIGIQKYWVYENTNGDLLVIDKYGNPIADNTYNVCILRSGRKNIQNVSIGSITCRENPVSGSTFSFETSSKILSASATELTDKTYMACHSSSTEAYADPVNPFVQGLENNWRKYRDYSYLTQREYNTNLSYPDGSNHTYGTDIRDNGIYTDFVPFWQFVSSAWTDEYDEPWIWVNEVTKYSQRGLELENMNALGIYSSAVYGYNGTKMILNTNNAQLKETGFDGFEDPVTPVDDHFSIRPGSGFFDASEVESGITDEKSHTGRRAVRVIPGDKVNMIRHIQECEMESNYLMNEF
ncbi:MAG: hypothetical protein JXR48_01965 [Candidatus Delongbacteria bacterium]|nr:hypothetical protein [Candidatus Delongbacteria bacterium]